MRKTIDTNILVRALVDQGDDQSRVAAEVFASETLHIPVTVMLETEWVLRSNFQIDRSTVCDLLGSIMSLPNVVVDQRPIVGAAIAAHAEGFDFADALHLNSSTESESFLTFDKKLLKAAAKFGAPIFVSEPKIEARQ
jgi:predicted nucleic-acid-binding protein